MTCYTLNVFPSKSPPICTIFAVFLCSCFTTTRFLPGTMAGSVIFCALRDGLLCFLVLYLLRILDGFGWHLHGERVLKNVGSLNMQENIVLQQRHFFLFIGYPTLKGMRASDLRGREFNFNASL